MSKYIVTVNRIAYGEIDIEVEAANEDEAKERALDHAPSESFSEHSSEYEIGHITKWTSTKTIIINGIEQRDCLGLHHDD